MAIWHFSPLQMFASRGVKLVSTFSRGFSTFTPLQIFASRGVKLVSTFSRGFSTFAPLQIFASRIVKLVSTFSRRFFDIYFLQRIFDSVARPPLPLLPISLCRFLFAGRGVRIVARSGPLSCNYVGTGRRERLYQKSCDQHIWWESYDLLAVAPDWDDAWNF